MVNTSFTHFFHVHTPNCSSSKRATSYPRPQSLPEISFPHPSASLLTTHIFTRQSSLISSLPRLDPKDQQMSHSLASTLSSPAPLSFIPSSGKTTFPHNLPMFLKTTLSPLLCIFSRQPLCSFSTSTPTT